MPDSDQAFAAFALLFDWRFCMARHEFLSYIVAAVVIIRLPTRVQYGQYSVVCDPKVFANKHGLARVGDKADALKIGNVTVVNRHSAVVYRERREKSRFVGTSDVRGCWGCSNCWPSRWLATGYP